MNYLLSVSSKKQLYRLKLYIYSNGVIIVCPEQNMVHQVTDKICSYVSPSCEIIFKCHANIDV